jgi:E1A/CREB-binding protein
MDLGTVKRKLEAGVYESVQQFEKDVRLVFYNAMMFNPPHHYVHIDAEVLSLRFQEEMSKENGRVSTNKSRLHGHSCKVCFGNTCAICHQKCIELATPNYTCSMGCGTEIRKGTTYYLTRDGTRLYCKRCYGKAAKTFFVSHQNNISSDLRTDVEDIGGILPGFFSKERCDAEVEPWVKCSKCEKWMHQICGLYNPVYGIYSDSHRYICPRCIAHIKDQSATFSPSTEDTPHISFASIPVCEMSEYIEGFMRQGLLEVNENEAAASLGIRVISFANEKMSFSETLVDAFKSNSASSIRFVPKEVLFISRGIFLYQTHQGADVCLFALFTQEFGDDCSLEQNRRSFYIAYIDSIRYLQPASARTTAYHLIMMAYFDHARKRGFERAHIWSCPPQKRISYVFWCRPPFQKTPSSDHLRRWYETLLKKSKEMGIVMSWTNMYERYFSTTSNKNFEMSDTNLSYGTRRSMAHVVDPIDYEWPSPELPPLFEGDFIPSELERIVSRMTEKVVNVSFKARLKLRDVFVQCRSAVQRLKNDLLVVDLNTSCANSRIGCNPTRHIPTWCSGTSRLFGSRFKFHQLCSHNSYQFDSLRRAKHSTMMLVHHFFNSDIVQVNIFCSECSLLITHAVYWRCRQCTQYILCDLCYKHKGAEHVHSMIFDRRMTI